MVTSICFSPDAPAKGWLGTETFITGKGAYSEEKPEEKEAEKESGAGQH